MKRQLLYNKIWMIINKRTNWVPTFKRVENSKVVNKRENEEDKREKDFS
jgi:hypothetical protein